MPLDELALRKPGFSEGYKVTLADGQEWKFPRPRIRFRPRIGADGRVEVGGGPSFGPEYDQQLDILFGAVEAEPLEQLRVKFEVAVRLLRSNYDLTDAQLADLVVFEPDDDAGEERWDQLSRAIMGIAPKPSPAT
jgi:hypothetical protein